ncbi:MAG: acyl-CoA dehydrogenase family protein [Actinomycetota bacterium]|nr:acyl-CoA dehydrogenase family protein [Actinomycetota bacterium]
MTTTDDATPEQRRHEPAAVQQPRGPGADALHAAQALSPMIAARAHDIEVARRLPRDVLDQLISAGCFRMLLPESHGGAGLDLPSAMRVIEELSRSDASVGWAVGIGASLWCDLVGLPRSVFDALYAGGPDTFVAGVFSPAGVAVPADGGYRVRGRWGFASGIDHCAWLYGNCVEDGDGSSSLRTVVFRRDEVEVEDTWHVVGLRGTGSHHFRADDVVVPTERTFPTFGADPCVDVPLVRVPQPAMYSLEIAVVALGTAQGALDDLIAVATGKVPLLAKAPLAAHPPFQLELGTMQTELRAARALLYEEAGATWRGAEEGSLLSLEQRARVRAAAAWATARAADVVTGAYRAAGSTSVYDESRLQRRLRDVHMITQHFLVKAGTLEAAGAVFAGREPDVAVF